MSSVENRPRRGRPPQANRPQLIADAAIRLLAEDGSRSLSHRRVDIEAGLPIGSSVHLAPTRNDLLLMAAGRLGEMSAEELQPFADDMRRYGAALRPEDVAGGMIALWKIRLGKDQLYRLRAEMTILLSQDIEGELRARLQPNFIRIIEFWQDTMRRLGIDNADAAGMEFNLWSRGLFYLLAMRGGFIDEADARQVEEWLSRFLTNLRTSPPKGPPAAP